MKILYIDVVLNGHHIPYINGLLNDKENQAEKILLIPKTDKDFGVNTYTYNREYDYRKIKDYFDWIMEIKRVVKAEKPDVIHILYGDVLYRHFAAFLGWIKRYSTIVTFHQFRRNRLIDISLKRIFKCIRSGVVHTEFLKNDLNSLGLKNVEHIEYPQLHKFLSVPKKEACETLGIKYDKDITVLGVIGETRYYKGFDILLESLKHIEQPFCLLIAGKEGYYDRQYIEEHTKEYRDKVHLILKFLSNDELGLIISASDYIMLPYRKRFDGASGPLTEAVWARKSVIAANHGSLGNLVMKNKLGYLFESENTAGLTKTIKKALLNNYKWNDCAEKYRESISLDVFRCAYRNLYK